MHVMIIGRWAKPIRSDSVFYNLSPVPRLTRYQRRQCILNQREYIVNLIGGDFLIQVQGQKWQQNISLSYTPSRLVRMKSLTTVS